MSGFTFKKTDTDEGIKYDLRGHIGEDVSFEELIVEEGNVVVLNFKEVSSINSCGIREWIRWTQKFPANAKIYFEFCPKIIVDQINMVSGFLPVNGAVRSFYVPYYNEDTEEEKMILFTEGKEYTQDSVDAPEEITDDSSGDTLEIDVIEAKYFKFINSKAG